MGIDSSAIFDCNYSRDELLDLTNNLHANDEKFASIFTYTDFKEHSWIIDTYGEFEEQTEISSCWPFGLWVEDSGLLCLWNIFRWKFILQHFDSHYEEFFNSTRLIANIVNASRIIYLSDYLLINVDTTKSFDQILPNLGKPSETQNKYEIVKGYWNIFFFEQLES